MRFFPPYRVISPISHIYYDSFGIGSAFSRNDSSRNQCDKTDTDSQRVNPFMNAAIGTVYNTSDYSHKGVVNCSAVIRFKCLILNR